ncbi:hypothetical protein AHF37_09929 [Paragonimus kellicotti]|nr:hypothetical protein AHF37_09929 [Paragonimus kellicotti]
MPGSDAPLNEQLKTEIEAIAFKSSVDLREYAAQVDDELLVLEEQLIQKYLSVGPEVASLHKQITACDAILQRMEAILSNFHKDLGTISSEIQDLQTKSAIMNKRLQNRQVFRITRIHCHILVTPVTEQDFLEHLHELDHKISFSREQSMAEYRSFEDVNTLLRKLKIKAVTKIREYLLQKIYALRKPLTNYQIPQNQMLKYRFYNEFLLAHDRETAAEIRTEYVNTMSKVYYSYFKAYCSKLNKLQVVGHICREGHATRKATRRARCTAIHWQHSNGRDRFLCHEYHQQHNLCSVVWSLIVGFVGLFGLGERSQRVLSRSNLEAPIILPHVAAKADVKRPVKNCQLTRAKTYCYCGAVSKMQIVPTSNILHLVTPLLPDADNVANRSSPKDSHSTAELSPSYSDFVLTSPHSSPCSGGHPSAVNSGSIAADSTSVTTANIVAPPLDARILSRLAQLQTQFEMVLALLADSFPRQRLKCVFLINNYDLVISVLTYPVEVLFRSVQFALLDAACREYFFLSDFFLLSPGSGHPSPSQTPRIQSRAQSGAALAVLFDQVMGRTLAMLHKQIDTRLIPVASHDALGMLICLQLLHAFLRLAQERGVPVMDQFWTTIIETFWVRVTDRLDAHIASLQHDFDVTSFTNGARALANSTAGCGGGSNLPARAYALIRPHPVARRYAELAASLHSIGHGFPGSEYAGFGLCLVIFI